MVGLEKQVGITPPKKLNNMKSTSPFLTSQMDHTQTWKEKKGKSKQASTISSLNKNKK